MALRWIMLVGATLALAGCATPETRLRTGLTDAGIPAPMARCMASRMIDRLSLIQLRRLQSLGALGDRDVGSLSVDQFLHHVRALRDPEIVTVTSSAGLRCALTN